MYGYKDSDDVKPNAGGAFGLNRGANITKFEFNPNAGAGGAAMEAIDFTVKISDKEFRLRFFPVNKVFAKNGGELTDKTSQEYIDGLEKETNLFNATLTDIVRCFVSVDELKAALNTPIADFKTYALLLQRLIHSVPNWDKKSVDVFLQYQWKPSGTNTVTFLELPKNVKHGSFICASPEGEYIEEKTPTHLRYVSRTGEKHPISRGDWFLKSHFANRIDLGAGSSPSGTETPGSSAADW